MSTRQREIYHSENGDRWFLCSDPDGRVYIEHRANVSSGGTISRVQIADFLRHGKAGPEHQAMLKLIDGLTVTQS